MSTPHLMLDDDPSPADVRVLEDGLYAYNVERTGYADGEWLALFLRDPGGHVVGGLSGWTWARWLKVANLWVREDLRRQRYGSQLLTAAETEATARGCTRAILDTYSFQAPDFYKKRGYRIVAAVDDFPAGHTHYTLTKDLQRGSPPA